MILRRIGLLNPIRHSLAATTSSKSVSHFTKSYYYRKLEPSRTWRSSLESVLRQRCSNFHLKVNAQRSSIQNFGFSGVKRFASVFGASVIFASVYFRPHFAYAMDGHDVIFDDYRGDLSGNSNVKRDSITFWASVRKFWLPTVFLITVYLNWANPFSLAVQLLVLLFTTRPHPLSVYLFVDELCHHYMRQKPHLYIFKSLYANKVEVEDYKLLCIARVEIGDQKLRLVGILGGWWSLPSSQKAKRGLLSILRQSLQIK